MTQKTYPQFLSPADLWHAPRGTVFMPACPGASVYIKTGNTSMSVTAATMDKGGFAAFMEPDVPPSIELDPEPYIKGALLKLELLGALKAKKEQGE